VLDHGWIYPFKREQQSRKKFLDTSWISVRRSFSQSIKCHSIFTRRCHNFKAQKCDSMVVSEIYSAEKQRPLTQSGRLSGVSDQSFGNRGSLSISGSFFGLNQMGVYTSAPSTYDRAEHCLSCGFPQRDQIKITTEGWQQIRRPT